MADRSNRGRWKGGSPGGGRAGKSKLKELAKQARDEWPEAQKTMSLRAFAAKYGIQHPSMIALLRGETYTDPEYWPDLK